MTFRTTLKWTGLILLCGLFAATDPYPIDGYAFTGIRRLNRLEQILEGKIKDTRPVPGAQKSINDIHLNLINPRGDSLATLPSPDPDFQKAINNLFGGLDPHYSIAVLDITAGKKFRLAMRKETAQYQPGSVGKLAVVTGFFTELKKIYPDSLEKRYELLRTRMVRGGRWDRTDSHTVPFFDPATGHFVKRTLQEKDVFSLYEWLDHMLSVSNNGAASVCWREAVLMRAFGKEYPCLTDEQANTYFASTPKSELSDIAISVVNDPLRALGITTDEWRLGSLFTEGGEYYIPSKGGSTGTPLGLIKFLIALERGLVVDMPSSLEIKRLMYMTDRRIRYANASILSPAAVYFKSGSLYKCKPEEGYTCEKYKGNVDNFMNSVAIIEHPDSTQYMVVLMSNVLKKNSASDHQALASSIDKIVRKK